jgi:hypothetical protein
VAFVATPVAPSVGVARTGGAGGGGGAAVVNLHKVEYAPVPAPFVALTCQKYSVFPARPLTANDVVVMVL